MKISVCPYCREEIKSDAIICKHCHERIYRSRADLIMAMVMERIRYVAGVSIDAQSVSVCEASCYARHAGDKARLNECLDGCKEAIAIAVVAEKLHRELILNMADIIWGGGDIDPTPFEKAVRNRFSHPTNP